MPMSSQSIPGAGLRSFRTRDIDEQAALLHGWNQTYNQLSGGAFHGELCEAELGGLYLFREWTSNSLYQIGELPRDQIAVGVPLSLPGSARFCGQVCDGTQVHVFSGRDGFEFHSPHGLDMAGFVVPQAILSGIMLDDDQEVLESQPRNARVLRTPPDVWERLRLFLTGAFETVQTMGPDPKSPALGDAFSRDMARTLIEALSAERGQDAPSMSESKCWLIVQDAKELAHQSGSENLTVEDLCRTLEVSRRTLQTCFQTALGIRPATYLRVIRLNAARRTLKEGGSVTEAAVAWGFWHFGRFAQDYRQMFGEAPSETVRRRMSASSTHLTSAPAATPDITFPDVMPADEAPAHSSS